MNLTQKHCMKPLLEDSEQDKAYAEGFNHALTLADESSLTAELAAWLDKTDVTSDNIGSIRAQLMMPWDSEWNGIVRDETANRENKGVKV